MTPPATPDAVREDSEAVKLVYIKRWRTLVKLPAKYADEIVEALRIPTQTSLHKLSDPHPHWSVENKNENYPNTVEEWDPNKDPVSQHLTLAVKRLRMAIDRDDPRAPDQMALVSRWDLMTLVHDWWHKCAIFDIWREERKKALASTGARENLSECITGAHTTLTALLAAVHANDPKREILVRIGDIKREVVTLSALITKLSEEKQEAVKAEREACAKVAEMAFGGNAHTYASENADLYRGQDIACHRISNLIRARQRL